MRLCISWVFATVTTLVISAEGFPSFPAYKSHSILSSDKDQHLSSSSSALVPSLARAGGTSASSREKGDSYFDDEDNPKAEAPSETQRDLFDSLLRLRFARDQAEGEDKENDGKDGGRNKEKERRRLATMTENFIDGNLGSAVRKRGQSFQGLSMEVPDAYSLRKEDRPPNSLVVFKKNADGPTLSIYSPLDVLRQRMLLDLARRRMQQSEHQIKANEEILKDLGKRSASYWQSAWSSTGDDKQPFRQRNSRGNASIDSEGYV